MVSHRYLQQHVDEVFRVKGGGKHINYKCPTCKRSVHLDRIVLADNINGVLTRHVCSMKGRLNNVKNL